MKPTGEKNAIPDGWQRVRLGDVADVAFSGVDKRTVDEELPVQLCNYTDVFYNRRIRLGMDLMGATATYSERDRWTLQKGDVLFTKDSETPDEIGIPAFVVDDMPGVLCGYHLGLARPIKDVVDGEFLAEALSSGESRKQFARIANGVTRFGLTLDATKALPILLPPLPEQRAIAAVLDSVDAAIEGAKAVIATIEGLRDALLHDLLTRGLPGQHTEFRDVPGLGTIPADWDVVRLGDVLESTTYGTNSPLSAVGDIPVLRMNNLQNGQINLTDVRRANLNDKETGELNLACGDILFNRTNSLDLVGKVAVVRNLPRPMSFASYLVRLRVKKERANPFWLSALLWSDDCQARIRKYATPGVSQANINPTSLKTLTVSLPPLAEQRDIAASLDGVYSAIQVAREELGRLRLLKESTAEAMLTGRMRVFSVQGIPDRESIDVQRT